MYYWLCADSILCRVAPHALGSEALKLFPLLNSAPVVYFQRNTAAAPVQLCVCAIFITHALCYKLNAITETLQEVPSLPCNPLKMHDTSSLRLYYCENQGHKFV